MKIASLIGILEDFAPVSLQENYDNSGLLIGNKNDEVKSALICLDITEAILEEAIENNFGLIISHHPLIFKGINKLNCENAVERIIVKAIKNNIAIYAIHTNADNVLSGVNGMIAAKLGLIKKVVLEEKKTLFRKLVTFCPLNDAEAIRKALFEVGAGEIGDYSNCSFNVEGKGTFKGNENANPNVGKMNELHFEPETRIEVIYPNFKEQAVVEALISSHPYEKVAYDIFELQNQYPEFGSGLIGELSAEINEIDFLNKLKTIFDVKVIKHTKLLNRPIRRVAVCGGSGSFLIKNAKKRGADIFITGDVKYHDYFEAENEMIIADIGHYESEQFTKDLIHSILIKKIPNFALQISEQNTNPINYY